MSSGRKRERKKQHLLVKVSTIERDRNRKGGKRRVKEDEREVYYKQLT